MTIPSTLTAAQQAIRATGITGSEIAALAGCSRWRQPVDVYADKVGDVAAAPDTGESHHLERGVFLERGLLDWYAYRTGAQLAYPGTLRHPQLPLVIATPDAVAHWPDAPPRVVECKSPDWRARGHWGEPGSGAIPSYYMPQIQWELAVTGCSQADVIALLDGDLQLYTVDYDPGLFHALYTVALLFWNNHVTARLPPSPDASAAYGNYLRRKFPVAVHELAEATQAQTEYVRQLYVAEHHLAAWEAKRDAAKHALMAAIGDASGLQGPWGRITYRNNKPSAKVDYRAIVEAMAPPPELLARHTHTQATGPRVFRPTFAETDMLLGIPPVYRPAIAPAPAASLEQPAGLPGPQPQALGAGHPRNGPAKPRTRRKGGVDGGDAAGLPAAAMHAGVGTEVANGSGVCRA